MRRGNNCYLRRLVDEVDDDAGDIDSAGSLCVVAKIEELIRAVSWGISIDVFNDFSVIDSHIRFFKNRSTGFHAEEVFGDFLFKSHNNILNRLVERSCVVQIGVFAVFEAHLHGSR